VKSSCVTSVRVPIRRRRVKLARCKSGLLIAAVTAVDSFISACFSRATRYRRDRSVNMSPSALLRRTIVSFSVEALTSLDLGHIWIGENAARSLNSPYSIPGASIRGLMRHAYRQVQASWGRGEDSALQTELAATARDEEYHFGGMSRVSSFRVTDLRLGAGASLSETFSYRIDAQRGSSSEPFVRTILAPPGTVFHGSVLFDPSFPGFARDIVLTALRGIDEMQMSVGRGKTRGHGLVKVTLTSQEEPLVFISYSWGARDRMDWALGLAARLSAYCRVEIDQYSAAFIRVSHQEQTNQWMADRVEDADRVICILTPDYKKKADSRTGGVGFEFERLAAQSEYISPSIGRHVAVLLEGPLAASRPDMLESAPLVDMSSPAFFDKGVERLAGLLLYQGATFLGLPPEAAADS
jgi:TIR domain-containing protein/RAMP superfamily protein